MITFKQYIAELHKPKQLTDFIKLAIARQIVSDPSEPAWKNYGKRYSFRTSDEVEELIDSTSFRLIGNGSYAFALANHNYPYVIKVFETHDRAYSSWLQFCLANQHNPWVPKIKGKPVNIKAAGHSFVRMEKLFHLSQREHDNFGNIFWVDKVADKDVRSIQKFLENSGFDMDLHGENVMKRANGQFVITDPIAT